MILTATFGIIISIQMERLGKVLGRGNHQTLFRLGTQEHTMELLVVSKIISGIRLTRFGSLMAESTKQMVSSISISTSGESAIPASSSVGFHSTKVISKELNRQALLMY